MNLRSLITKQTLGSSVYQILTQPVTRGACFYFASLLMLEFTISRWGGAHHPDFLVLRLSSANSGGRNVNYLDAMGGL